MSMPYTNAEIAGVFEGLAEVLEIKKELVFKVRAYRRAAEVIRSLPEPLEGMVRQGRELKGIPGVGEAIAKKIAELVATGRVATYEREKSSLPPIMQLLMDVPGVSPKTAWRVLQETGATTPGELERALDSGKLAWLPAAGPGSATEVRAALHAQARREG
jgi:DNA polymerase (family 10)